MATKSIYKQKSHPPSLGTKCFIEKQVDENHCT